MEKVNNLKASLRSKTEEANDVEEKRAKMEERFNKVMEQNQLHARINIDLDSRISVVRAENDKLQSKIERPRAKLQHKEDSFLLQKTHKIYHMRRKSLEEEK